MLDPKMCLFNPKFHSHLILWNTLLSRCENMLKINSEYLTAAIKFLQTEKTPP